jgi:UMF1 family MFS transporter
VAIALAAIYAEQVIGFVQQETMVLIFVLNIAAALGAFAFGYGQDRLGHKRALGLTLVGWVLLFVVGVPIIAFEAYMVWSDRLGIRIGDIFADTQVVDAKVLSKAGEIAQDLGAATPAPPAPPASATRDVEWPSSRAAA